MLETLVQEWLDMYNKSDSILCQYAALRIILEQVRSLIKLKEEAATNDALKKYAQTCNSTVYSDNGLSIHIRFNNFVEPCEEIDELNQKIQQLELQIKQDNADKISAAIAQKEKLVKQLEEAEVQIAIFSTSPELEQLKDAREELVRSLSTKRATLVGKYRPI